MGGFQQEFKGILTQTVWSAADKHCDSSASPMNMATTGLAGAIDWCLSQECGQCCSKLFAQQVQVCACLCGCLCSFLGLSHASLGCYGTRCQWWKAWKMWSRVWRQRVDSWRFKQVWVWWGVHECGVCMSVGCVWAWGVCQCDMCVSTWYMYVSVIRVCHRDTCASAWGVFIVLWQWFDCVH